jgi:acyl-CoA synthetase (NDP forming)
VSSFLGAEGVPELLRVPDVTGHTAGRGSVPSYPAVEAAVRALARVVGYAVWLRTPDGRTDEALGDVDPGAAKKLVGDVLTRHGDGAELEQDELTALLAAYGIELWASRPVTSLRQAQAAGRALGWDVVLKATADEMRDAWESLNTLITEPEKAGFVVQKNSPPGVPVAVRSIEDPLFGPVVSFGISGPVIDLLEDKAFRIPPLMAGDAAAMVREIKSSPMLFGYRGSEVVDISAVERLILRVAQLQHDLPQVSAMDLSLVLAGADGVKVLTAAARVDPVLDPRSDWFVRRLPRSPGDTLPD